MEHVVWFEDVRSITAKWDLIREFGLSGARILEPDASVPGQLAVGGVSFQRAFAGSSALYAKSRSGDQLFVFYNVVSDPECIRKEPAYGDRPPDSRDPEDRERGQCVGKGLRGFRET